MDVGARLKEARIAKGLSLESLQETTKIQKRYLAAIEEGNFHILPGKFYARAFIKEYADAVGIDPNELLEEHKEEIPKSEEENEVPYTRIERSRKESNNSDRSGAIFTVLPKIIVVLLIVGILVAAIWFYNQSNSSNDPKKIEEPEGNVIITNPEDNNPADVAEDDAGDEEGTDDTESAEENPEEETSEEMEVEVVEVGTGSPPESTIEITNPGDELLFTFESQSSVWLDVKNSAGESLYAALVDAAGSPVELDLTGEESIYLNIGSTPNLSIQINGVEIEYPVDPNERDHQRLWININQ